MPHGYCFEWRPGVLWLHVSSDLAIAFTYFSLTFTLFYFTQRRHDLPFRPVFWLFASFIGLCGTTHLLSIWVLWHPNYYVEGYVKAITAVVSIATLIATLIILPEALKLLHEELRLAAKRLALATSSGGIGIWEWDIPSNEMVWDSLMHRLYDVDPHQRIVNYDLWIGSLHPEDRPRVEQELADAAKANARFDTHFRIVWRNGSVHHSRALGEVTYDADGRALRMLGVNWDVTQEVAESLALQEATRRMKLAADTGAIGILELDLERNLTVADEWASRILGLAYPPGQAVSGDLWKLRVHPEDRERQYKARQDAIAGIAPYQLEYRIVRNDGSIRHLNSFAHITRTVQGQALQITGSIQDVTERKAIDAALLAAATESRRLAEELTVQHQLMQVTLQSIGDAVVRTDVQGNVIFTNATAEKLLGLLPCASKRPPIDEITRMIDASSQKAALEGAVGTLDLPADCTLLRNDGRTIAVEGCMTPIDDQNGEAGKVIVFRDATTAREIVNQMKRAAYHDTLTGLPNRLLLSDRIEQAIAIAPRHGNVVAVLFLDLDGFKHVNDSLGHAIGDKLLTSVGERLVGSVRASDTVSRQGGDEFIVLLSEMREPADAAISAQRILDSVGETHCIAGHELHVTASIGVSLYPADGHDATTLLKAADTAMYKVKASGRHGYQFFEHGMEAASIERQYIEESLRRAIKNNEFTLHYQPKINIKTGAIAGAEALIRWTHPERGPIPPALFIPVAEDCGLIRALGSWVLREACEQGRRWIDAGLPAINISVNVSPIELAKSDFLGDVRAILGETGYDPEDLELEMTEGVMMKQAASSDATFKALKDMGLRLAIDDFGTGYSSLSYLTRFPIDTIKIDQSFIRQISADPAETAIVTAVISMARSLHFNVVAEGVETRKEFDFLANLGCDEAQGYYFSRPVAAASFAPLLANCRSRPARSRIVKA